MSLPVPVIQYPEDGSVRPVRRFVWRPVELPPLQEPTVSRLSGRRVALVGGREQVADSVASALVARGAHVYRLAPGESGARLRERSGPLDGVVDLSLQEPFSPEAPDVWEAPLRQSVEVIQACYAEWLEEEDAQRLFYMPVTMLGGAMGHEGQAPQPLGGIWAGFAKGLPRELPNCNIKVLDVAPGELERLGELIARELYVWDLVEVGHREGRRYTLLGEEQAVGPPVVELTPRDTVLISGGGRGIGLALARALCRNFGCRAVVTGRKPLPALQEPWLRMDDASFRAWRHEQLRRVPPGETVGSVKRRLEALERERELFHNVRQAQQEGLALSYEACDFNSLEEVERLVSRFGPELRGVIHNAGTDAPIRLTEKKPEDFVSTVRVKVKGFLHLLQAVRGRPLAFFCNVGSMTGRMGGMAGQTDYGAGNEGLARLGLWAAPQVRFPLKTLCWVTWDNLGLIANFKAATRYMSAMNVEEGLYRWQRELLAGGSGEVGFPGHTGQALVPGELGRYWLTTDFPSFSRLASLHTLLGELVSFRRFRSVRARHRLRAPLAPALSEFSVGGAPALPISLLLEYACTLGEWVTPEAWPDLFLREVRGLDVRLGALAAADEELVLEKEGSGRWEGSSWVLALQLRRGTGSEPVASLRLVYERTPAPPEPPRTWSAEQGPRLAPRGGAGLRWSCERLEAGRWSTLDGGGVLGRVRPALPGTLWSTPLLPQPLLPTSHLEALLRAALEAARIERGLPLRLSVGSLRRGAGQGPCEVVLRSSVDSPWFILDATGVPWLEAQEVRFA